MRSTQEKWVKLCIILKKTTLFPDHLGEKYIFSTKDEHFSYTIFLWLTIDVPQNN